MASVYMICRERKMVRLLGRISDKRIFFEDSKTIIDHGSTAAIGAGGEQTVHTHFKSILRGWAAPRKGLTACYINVTSGGWMAVKEDATLAAGATIDWFAIGTTA